MRIADFYYPLLFFIYQKTTAFGSLFLSSFLQTVQVHFPRNYKFDRFLISLAIKSP